MALTVTKTDLLVAMAGNGQFFSSDQTYACPQSEWLLGPFWSWYWETFTALGVMKWERTNDCDDFAMRYATAAKLCHSITKGGVGNPEGLAVGEFWYQQDASGGHAIVVAMTPDKGLIFIEPQNGKEMKLSASEIASCILAKF